MRITRFGYIVLKLSIFQREFNNIFFLLKVILHLKQGIFE